MTSDINRRELLGAAAVGAVAAAEAIAADAVAPVADKASTIKITSLRAFVVGPKAYFKIETSHKITGWGEVTGSEPKVACALAESLFELLDQENPTRVEHLWQKMYRSHRDMRGGPFMVHVTLRHRHGVVGHHRQAARRPGLSAPRRTDPRQNPHVSQCQVEQDRHRRPASLVRQLARSSRRSSSTSNKSANRSGRTAPSCSTPIARCRRRC